MVIKDVHENLVELLKEKRLTIDIPHPNDNLYDFSGWLKISNASSEGAVENEEETKLKLKYAQFIPRGSTIRNSESIIALVIYPCKETKQVLNSGKYKYKMSRGEHRLNFALIINVILMLSLAGIFTIMNYRWTEYLRSMHDYLF